MISIIKPLVYIVCVSVLCGSGADIKIGVIYPLTPGVSGLPYGNTWVTTARTAAQSINNERLIPGYSLEIVPYDTHDTPSGTIMAAFQCAVVDQCVGVIGDSYSDRSELVQYVLQNYSIPQISAASTATELSNKTEFPTFMRTVPDDTISGYLIAHVVAYFNWTNIAMIVGSDTYSISLYNSFVLVAKQLKINIVAQSILDPLTPNYFTSVANVVNAYVQVVVLFAEKADAQEILLQAYDQGILAPGFVWIGDETLELVDITVFPSVDALLGTIAVRPAATANTSLAQQYLQQMAKLNITDVPMNSFVYDAVYTYAYAFNTMVQGNGTVPWENKTLLLQTLLATNFSGVTGQVRFDKNGNRIPFGSDILNWRPGGILTPVAFISWGFHIRQFLPVIWSDNSTNTPADILFLYTYPPAATIKLIFGVIAGSLVVVVLVLLFLAIDWRIKFMSNKRAYLSVHIPNALGAILGYSSILFIVFGVSNISCILAPVLADLSFLICGGVLTFRTIHKFVDEYSTHTEERSCNVSIVKISLYSFWASIILVNVGALTYTVLVSQPDTHPFYLEKNFYELHCTFGQHAIIFLPTTVGLLFLFAGIAIRLKMFVNAGVVQDGIVRTHRTDTMNGVMHTINMLAFVVAAVVLGTRRATQTQIDITACAVIIVANMPIPFNLVAMFFKKPEYAPTSGTSQLPPRVEPSGSQTYSYRSFYGTLLSNIHPVNAADLQSIN